MRNLQIVFFVILACIFSTQAIRHAHHFVFAYEESMLAPIGEFFEMEQEVRSEASTEELLEEYKAVEDSIRQLKDSSDGETDPEMNAFQIRQQNPELFHRQQTLHLELTQRELMSNELRDLWIYSIAGLILVILGCLIYFKIDHWTGLPLILAGFLELVWWSSPSFNMGGAVTEYRLLLVNKMIVTAIGLFLLFTLWALARKTWKS